jgi:hypothetical protein
MVFSNILIKKRKIIFIMSLTAYLSFQGAIVIEGVLECRNKNVYS